MKLNLSKKARNYTSEQTFEERINDTNKAPLYDRFVSFIYDVAKQNDKTATEVWHMWQDHVKQNESMDQSPTTSEFLEWNKLKGERI